MRRNLDLAPFIRSGVVTVRRNPIVMVPMLIAIILLFLFSLVLRNVDLGFAGGFLQMVIMVALCVYAHGVTVSMAWDARKRGSTSLNAGAFIARRAAPRLLPVSLIIGLLFNGGLILIVVPGLAVLLLTMFTMPSMIARNLSAYDALCESMKVVKNEFRSAMFMFIMLSLTGLVLFMVGVVITLSSPLLGLLVVMALWAAFFATASAIVLDLYLELSEYKE